MDRKRRPEASELHSEFLSSARDNAVTVLRGDAAAAGLAPGLAHAALGRPVVVIHPDRESAGKAAAAAAEGRGAAAVVHAPREDAERSIRKAGCGCAVLLWAFDGSLAADRAWAAIAARCAARPAFRAVLCSPVIGAGRAVGFFSGRGLSVGIVRGEVRAPFRFSGPPSRVTAALAAAGVRAVGPEAGVVVDDGLVARSRYDPGRGAWTRGTEYASAEEVLRRCGPGPDVPEVYLKRVAGRPDLPPPESRISDVTDLVFRILAAAPGVSLACAEDEVRALPSPPEEAALARARESLRFHGVVGPSGRLAGPGPLMARVSRRTGMGYRACLAVAAGAACGCLRRSSGLAAAAERGRRSDPLRAAEGAASDPLAIRAAEAARPPGSAPPAASDWGWPWTLAVRTEGAHPDQRFLSSVLIAYLDTASVSGRRLFLGGGRVLPPGGAAFPPLAVAVGGPVVNGRVAWSAAVPATRRGVRELLRSHRAALT